MLDADHPFTPITLNLRDTVHLLNERLSASMEAMQGQHEHEKELLLLQLSSLKSENEELSVENTALAAVLLGGAKDSLEKFCASSSCVRHESAQEKGAQNGQFIDEFAQMNRELSSTGARLQLHPSRAAKVTSATQALLELQELFERAAGNTKPQYEMEMKFAADMRSVRKELVECQASLSAAQVSVKQLEAERLSFSLRVEGETLAAGALHEERDGLLRKAAKEVSSVRLECVELGRKYESSKHDLSESRNALSLLNQDMLSLHEGVIGGLITEAEELKSHLKESIAQKNGLQKSLSQRAESSIQLEKEATEARAEKVLVTAELKAMEEEYEAKCRSLSDLRNKEAAALANKKVLQETISSLEHVAKLERNDLMSRISLLEAACEEQDGRLSARVRVEEDRLSSEIVRLLCQIGELKRDKDQHSIEKMELERRCTELEEQKLLYMAAEGATAVRIKIAQDNYEQAERTHIAEVEALKGKMILIDAATATERTRSDEEGKARDIERAAQYTMEMTALVEKERAVAADNALKVYTSQTVL